MENGTMRVDVNVSVGDVKCEIKNLNSLRSIRDAIEAEFSR